MAYTLTGSGQKADVIGSLRQQAAQQGAALVSQGERDQLNDSLNDAEKIVNELAGDADSVSISVTGHISQSDTALAVTKNVGVSISRGAAPNAVPPGGTGVGAPANGAPAAAPEQPTTEIVDAATRAGSTRV